MTSHENSGSGKTSKRKSNNQHSIVVSRKRTLIQDPTAITWLGVTPREPFYKLISAYTELFQLPEIKHAISPDHVRDTPARAVKALSELLSGYLQDPSEVLRRSFKSGKYDEMITVSNIKFTSLCAHHLLPFKGVVHFAYIPNGKVVGLSKIPRMVDILSRRLQVQENLSQQLVDVFQSTVKPRGCAAMVVGHHMCMSIRGIRKEGALMRTTALKGIFKNDSSAKAEFISGINIQLENV